jgi:hypothetical protein
LKKQFWFIVLFLVSLITLSSCAARSLEDINLVIIIGERANSYAITTGDETIIRSMIERSFSQDPNSRFGAIGNVSFVVSDGMPQALSVIDEDGNILGQRLYVAGTNNRVRDRNIRGLIDNTIIPFVHSDNFRAQHPQADLLSALWVATDIVRNMEGTGGDYILIIDSGITTSGHLNMTTIDIQDTVILPTEEVVRLLYEAGALPNMEGINVRFTGIGRTVQQTQPIPQNEPFRNQLISLWENVLVTAGANLVQPLAWSNPGTTPNMYFEINPYFEAVGIRPFPFVSTVFFDDIDPLSGTRRPLWISGRSDLTPGQGQPINGDDTQIETLVFGAHELGFVANSSEFYNPQNAERILQDVAGLIENFIEQYPTGIVYIVGSEARVHPDRDNTGQISAIRASRVRQELERFGIPSECLIDIGANTTVFSWRNAQEFPDGAWNGVNAQRNRVVAIIPDTSDEFVELQAMGFVE